MHARESRHMEQLDGLRAFAVLAVLVHHLLPLEPVVSLIGPGQYGVFLFFVLSGYLITGILLRCRDAMAEGQPLGTSLRQFYVRRFLRIVPVFYLVLGTAALANVHPVRESFWWHFGYLSNFYFASRGDWNGPVTPFWTLAMEEQFYLVWPWAVLLTPRSRLRATIAGLVVLCPITRWLYLRMGGPPFALGMLPFGNTDYLLIGALLAELQAAGVHGATARRVLGRLGLRVGLPVSVLVVVLARPAWLPGRIASTYFQLFVSHVTIGFFFFWLVDRASAGFGGMAGRILSLEPLRFVGTISYGLYVYHSFVIVMLTDVVATLGRSHPDWWQPSSDWSWLPARLATVVGIATVSWVFFEKPINDLKRFFPYRVERPAPAAMYLDEPVRRTAE